MFQLRSTYLAALASCSAFIAPHAHGQTTVPTAPVQTSLDRVIVTGSNIKRMSDETASPVQVYRREEIKQTGANTVRQILDTLTATSLNTLRDDGSTTSFAAGATGVGLRGLGKSATLVLLNGRRVAPYALADGGQEQFVNLDAIPADAIDRIEVLADGASAVYGSDAMAGVINIITKSTYAGLGLTASRQAPLDRSLGEQTLVGLIGGVGDMAKDGYNVMLNAEIYKRDGFFLSEVIAEYPLWHKQYVNTTFGNPSLTSWPGNIILGTVGADGSFTPASGTNRQAVAGCPKAQLNSANACTTDVNGLNQFSDPAKRFNLYSSGRLALKDGMEAFGEFSYSDTTTEYRDLPFGIFQPGTPYRWFDGNSKTIQIVNKPLLGIDNPANPTGKPVGLEYRFMDNLDMWSVPAKASQYRTLAGLKASHCTHLAVPSRAPRT